MKTEYVVWQLVRFKRYLFILKIVVSTCVYSIPLLSGLITSIIFDTFYHRINVGLNIPSLIALLVTTEVTYIAVSIASSAVWVLLEYSVTSLLYQNILIWFFWRASSCNLGVSSGAIWTYFRDDIEEVVAYFEAWIDIAGQMTTAIIAFIIMARINLPLTFFVLTPLISIIAVTHLASTRISR